MAPESANQKRKRGRRANASRNDEDASNSQQLTLTREGGLEAAAGDVEEAEMTEETRPRKRGRQTARSDVASQPQPEPEHEPEPEAGSRPLQIKKKRGQPSESQPRSQAANADPGPVTTQAKKQGRSQRKGAQNTTGTQEIADEEADDENEGNSSLVRRSARGRRPMGEWYKSPRGSKTNPDRMVEGGRTQEEPEKDSSPSRRRGRNQRPNNSGEVVSETIASSKQAKVGKKKGRTQDGNPTSESEQAPQKPPRKRAGRLPSSARVTSEADADAETENEPQPRARRKRGQPSAGHPSAPTAQDSTARSKQGRTRSLLRHAQNVDEDQVEEEGEEEERNNNQGGPKSRNNGKRPPQSRSAAEEASPQGQHNPHKPRRRRPKDQQEDPSIDDDNDGRTSTSQSQPKKRKHPPPPPPERSIAASPEPEPEPEPKPYRQIATQTRRVPRSVIESKWAPLDAPSIASVGSLLAASARPVLLRLGDRPTRRAQAAAALGAVANRLQSKLARGLPFPPRSGGGGGGGGGGRKEEKEKEGGGTGRQRADEELEYERTVAGIRGLEAALDPLLHSVDLLRRERDRARRELDREYRVLHTLGANARAQARERRGRLRRLHVLVPEKKVHGGEAAVADEDDDGGDEDDDDYYYSDDEDNDGDNDARAFGNNNKVLVGNAEGGGGGGGLFALDADAATADPEVARLAAQIADHMETMRGNLAQIDGVVPSIERSRALLASTLLPHLGKEQLEDALLG